MDLNGTPVWTIGCEIIVHVTCHNVVFCSYLQGILNDDRSMALQEVAKQLRGRGFVAWQHSSNVLLFLVERLKDWISTTHVIYILPK